MKTRKPLVINVNVNDLPADLQRQIEEAGINLGRFASKIKPIAHEDILKTISNDSYASSGDYKHLMELVESTDLILGKSSARKKHYSLINPRNSRCPKKYNRGRK